MAHGRGARVSQLQKLKHTDALVSLQILDLSFNEISEDAAADLFELHRELQEKDGGEAAEVGLLLSEDFSSAGSRGTQSGSKASLMLILGPLSCHRMSGLTRTPMGECRRLSSETPSFMRW